MKTKAGILVMLFFAIVLLVGCPGLPKMPVVKETLQTYDLYDLYLTTDVQQMTGVPKDHVKLGLGETVVVYARGCSSLETGGKWFELSPDIVVNWKSDPELEVTPTTRHMVTVKVIKPISVAAYVTAITTNKAGQKVEKIFTVEGK